MADGQIPQQTDSQQNQPWQRDILFTDSQTTDAYRVFLAISPVIPSNFPN